MKIVPQQFRILHAEARSILSKTTGFIAEAGFTHSLTPARNCTFGCTYCYVPHARHLRRPQTGRLESLGTAHHLQDQRRGPSQTLATPQPSDLLFTAGRSISTRRRSRAIDARNPRCSHRPAAECLHHPDPRITDPSRCRTLAGPLSPNASARELLPHHR